MNSSETIDDIIEYDSEKGVYRASYEESTATPSITLVEVIAALEGNDPTALEPLSHTIDMDALDTVLDHANGIQSTLITFSYKRYQVTIQSDGIIEVLPTDSDRSESQRAG